MFSRNVLASLLAASLVAVPVQRAQANDGAALLGGLLLGGIIVNEVNKNNQRKRTTTTTTTPQAPSGTSSAQREQNRQVQSALNYFGYNVGAVDGALGSKSRAGISRYQAEMGFQPDGRLDDYERDFLVGSHQRAMASSNVPPYNQVVATQGYNGLLRTYRNEQLGIATPNVNAPAVQQAAAPAPTPVPTPIPTQPEPVPARANTATLPDFTFGQVDRSVTEHCDSIKVLTAANGGMATSGRISDSELALNEQFCLARTYAMADSTSIVSTIPNMTDAQVEAQCSGLAQVIAPHMADLSTAAPQKVLSEGSSVIDNAGQPVAQLVSGGRVCLGVGYRIDDAQMALASAVLLASAGELGYGEMVAHHMREGFGTVQSSPQQSGAWMTMAVDAMSGGNAASGLGQSQDRIAVLTAAMSGAAPQAAALPSFPAPAAD